jgi:MtrB/PioB family decaheme-associated outer membrane protein
MHIRMTWLMMLTLWGQVSLASAQSGGSSAEPQQPAAPAAGPIAVQVATIEVGGRISSESGDAARYQRYSDLRDGATVRRFTFERETTAWAFDAEAFNVGYRDQRYWANFDRFGTIRATFEWNQVPLFYSADTRTLYTSASPGVLRLDDTLQAAVQNRTATLASFAGQASQFDLRQRRDTADLRLKYLPTPDLTFDLNVKSTHRTGQMPWMASFGFSNAIEVPLDLDQRTNDVSTSAEWGNARGMIRVGYDGSWFDNDVQELVWDNPLRITDQTHANAYSAGDAASQGRQDLWPNSTAHTVNVSTALKLAARTRVFGSVSYGTWLQDDALLPFTINTAIDPTLLRLERMSAEAEARILSTNLRMTSRPNKYVFLNAQYRRYDFDNRTPEFHYAYYARFDGQAYEGHNPSEPFSFTRDFVDVDAAFTPFLFGAIKLGYGREEGARTFRHFENTVENTLRASFDTTASGWAMLRVQYEHAKRTGEGLDEEVLEAVGEQLSLRQFDISDRIRDRVTAILHVMPIQQLGVSVSLGVGRDDRPDAYFGLQDNDHQTYAVGFDLSPDDNISFGASYGFENYTTLQSSRNAAPGTQFHDPTRDWATDMNEDVHTWTGSLEVARLLPRTSLRVNYDYSGSDARYLYVLVPDSTLPTPQQLPPVRNKLHRGTADVRLTLAKNVALGLEYRYDRYDVDDFAWSPDTLNSVTIPTYTNLNYFYRPYDVSTAFLRVIYSW